MTLATPPIRVLAVEDDPLYADLVRHLLRRDRSTEYELRSARTVGEALAVLNTEVIDVVLADLHLPDSAGMETVTRLLERTTDLPLVVLTGVDDDKVGTEAVRRGAQDYLVKQEVRGGILGRVLRYAIERKALEGREARRAADLEAAYGELERTQGLLLQAERMSAIGQMASGIAHEVKNPLAVVVQTIDYLDRVLLGDDPAVRAKSDVAHRLDAMRDAVARADAIVRELLEFSRPTRPQLEPVDLADVLRRAVDLASTQLSRVPIDVAVENGPPGVRSVTDARQLSQVLVNLVLNALQAAEAGSRVVARTREGFASPSIDDRYWIRAGAEIDVGKRVVVLEIEDTGKGIPADLLPQVFDPFFTTKAPGEGAGLGLAVSRRIVEQLGGYLEITSRLGRGTLARVVLPERHEVGGAD
jgi:signal transduction histidine kinase